MHLGLFFLSIFPTAISAEACNGKADEPSCLDQDELCKSPLLGVSNAMKHKCPVMCDSCITTTSTTMTESTTTVTTTTGTTTTTTTTPSNCFGVRDSPFCDDFAAHQCTSSLYGVELRDRCTNLCGTCTSTTSTSTATTQTTRTETTKTTTSRTTRTVTTRTRTTKTRTTTSRTTVTTVGCNGVSHNRNTSERFRSLYMLLYVTSQLHPLSRAHNGCTHVRVLLPRLTSPAQRCSLPFRNRIQGLARSLSLAIA